MQHDLFFPNPSAPTGPTKPNAAALHQYATPRWAAEELFDAHFSDLGPKDCVLEPTCGEGHFLAAIPPSVPAFGVEIDPDLAQIARARTQRNVIVADVLDPSLVLPHRVTAIIGNPKFEVDFIETLLDRARGWLPMNGRMGLVLPAYAMQTSRTVRRYNRDWSISVELIPRDIWGDELSKPLLFCLFQKDTQPQLIGMRLYRKTSEVRELPEHTQRLLIHGAMNSTSVWINAVDHAIAALGGRAPSMNAIYEYLEARRPTENTWWRAKVRQSCYRGRDQGLFRQEGEAWLRAA